MAPAASTSAKPKRKRQRNKRQAASSGSSSSSSDSSSEEENVVVAPVKLPTPDASSSSSEASSSSSEDSSSEEEGRGRGRRGGRSGKGRAEINTLNMNGMTGITSTTTTNTPASTARRPYPSRSPSPAAFNPANIPLGLAQFPLLKSLKSGPILADSVPGDAGFVDSSSSRTILGSVTTDMDEITRKKQQEATIKEAKFGDWWRARLVSEFEKELGGLAAVGHFSSCSE